MFSLDGERDAREAVRLGLDAVPMDCAPARLTHALREAGFARARVEALRRQDLQALDSTWAKRHAFGRERPVWRVGAIA